MGRFWGQVLVARPSFLGSFYGSFLKLNSKVIQSISDDLQAFQSQENPKSLLHNRDFDCFWRHCLAINDKLLIRTELKIIGLTALSTWLEGFKSVPLQFLLYTPPKLRRFDHLLDAIVSGFLHCMKSSIWYLSLLWVAWFASVHTKPNIWTKIVSKSFLPDIFVSKHYTKRINR